MNPDTVTNKVFLGINTNNSQGGVITNYGDSSDVNIVSDFVNNSANCNYSEAYGGVIFNSPLNHSAILGNITGDFINNSSNVYYITLGGAIYNTANIGDIQGSFAGNSANGKDYEVYGGAIYNVGTIGAKDESSTVTGGIVNSSFLKTPQSQKPEQRKEVPSGQAKT